MNPAIVSISPLMRLPLLLVVLVSAASSGAATRVPVQVMASVPLVARVEGPESIVLAPGATARISVRVAANVGWRLDVHSPNAFALRPATLRGPAGGASANTGEIAIGCSERAPGPQTITLVYTLMPW
jgi:hypothetical protein